MGTTRYTNYEPVKWDVPIWSPDWRQVDNLLTNREQGYQLAQAALNAPIDSSNLGTDPMVREQLRLYRQQAEADLAKTYTQPGGLQAGNKALQGYLRQIGQEKQPGGVEYQLVQNKADIAKSIDEIDKSNLPGNYKQIKKQEVISRYKGAVYKDELNNAPATNLIGYEDGQKITLDFAKEMAATTTDEYGEIKGLSQIAGVPIYMSQDGLQNFTLKDKTTILTPEQLFVALKPMLQSNEKYMAWNKEQTNLDFFSKNVNESTWKPILDLNNQEITTNIKELDKQIESSKNLQDKADLNNEKSKLILELYKNSEITSLDDFKQKYSNNLIDNIVAPISNLKKRNDFSQTLEHWENTGAVELFKAKLKTDSEAKDVAIPSDLITQATTSVFVPTTFTDLEGKTINDVNSFFESFQTTKSDLFTANMQVKNIQDNLLKVNPTDKKETLEVKTALNSIISKNFKDGKIVNDVNNDLPYGQTKVVRNDFKKLLDSPEFKGLDKNMQSKVSNKIVELEKQYAILDKTIEDKNHYLIATNNLWTELTGESINELPKDVLGLNFNKYKKENNIVTNKSEKELQQEIDDLKSGKKPYVPTGERSRYGQGTNSSQLSPEAYAYNEYLKKVAVVKNENPIVKKFAEGMNNIAQGYVTNVNTWDVNALMSPIKGLEGAKKYTEEITYQVKKKLQTQGMKDLIYLQTGETVSAKDFSEIQSQLATGKFEEGSKEYVAGMKTQIVERPDGLYVALTIPNIELEDQSGNKSKHDLFPNSQLHTVAIKVDENEDLKKLVYDVLKVTSYPDEQEKIKINSDLAKFSRLDNYQYPYLQNKFPNDNIIIKRNFTDKDNFGNPQAKYTFEIPESPGENGLASKSNRISITTNNSALPVDLFKTISTIINDNTILPTLKMNLGEKGTESYLKQQLQSLLQGTDTQPLQIDRIYNKYLKDAVIKTQSGVNTGISNFTNPQQSLIKFQ
jgi:hypothetical protein